MKYSYVSSSSSSNYSTLHVADKAGIVTTLECRSWSPIGLQIAVYRTPCVGRRVRADRFGAASDIARLSQEMLVVDPPVHQAGSAVHRGSSPACSHLHWWSGLHVRWTRRLMITISWAVPSTWWRRWSPAAGPQHKLQLHVLDCTGSRRVPPTETRWAADNTHSSSSSAVDYTMFITNFLYHYHHVLESYTTVYCVLAVVKNFGGNPCLVQNCAQIIQFFTSLKFHSWLLKEHIFIRHPVFTHILFGRRRELGPAQFCPSHTVQQWRS